MKKIVGVIFGLILTALSFSATAGFPSGYTEFAASDIEKAKVEAQATGKKILFVLGSGASCSGCKYVMNQLGTDALRAVYQPNFIGVYINYQESGGRELWYQYAPELRSAPHFILMTPKAEPICRASGGFNIGHEGRALGEKMLTLSRPAGVDTTKYRLPECSLL